ncbi:putative invertase inhibitor [Silene latifolia]|uniref:putative invertase inhibitor n=1 Tax=Silene latifolia TaxID=37657 RepID=UPI003D7760C4
MKHNKSLIISSSILISFIIQFSFTYSIISANLIPETCKKLSQAESKVYYDFCEAALGTAPGSANATSLTQLGSISFNLDISEVEPILTKIDTLLKDPKSELDPTTVDALKACTELYSGARDDLVSGLGNFEAEDYLMAKTNASGALDKVVSCENGFKKKQGMVSVLSTENSDFVKLVAISIGFTKLLGVALLN